MQFSLCGIDGSEVFRCMRLFQLFQAVFDRRFFVGTDFVAVLIQLFFGREDEGVGGIQLIDFLFRFLVGLGIGFRFLLNLLDFVVGQA